MNENNGLSASDVALLTGNGHCNGGWGEDSFLWIFALLILANGGFGNWGNGGFGGYGNMAAPMIEAANDGILPYFYNTQTQNDVNRGFSDLHLSDQLTAIQSAVNSGFGDTALGIAGVNQAICQTGNGITNAMNSGFANAETAANARQIANMQQAFAAQTATTNGINSLASQLAQCCCDNRLATCQTQNIVQSEGASTRFADANNTRDIIQSQVQGTQAILDKLCQLEIDGVRSELAAERRQNENLRSDLQYARGQASQIEQTAQILAGQAAEIDGVYNRLKNCPVPSMPVYGNTPIFTCQNGGCGCGNNI